MLETFEDAQLTQQPTSSLVIIENVLEPLASVLTTRWNVDNLHHFAIRASSKFFYLLKTMGQLKVAIKVSEPHGNLVI